MCIGIVRSNKKGMEVCVFGVAHSVSNNVRYDNHNAVICLGSVDHSLLDKAYELLKKNCHPQEIELVVTAIDPHSPSRQWIISNSNYGCHAWCGTRCSGFRGAFTSDNLDSAVILNWGVKPDIPQDLIRSIGGHYTRIGDVLTNLIVQSALLIPIRSAVYFYKEIQLKVDFGINEDEVISAFKDGNQVLNVPHNVKHGWHLTEMGYNQLFQSDGKKSILKAIECFENASVFDPYEIQNFIWRIYAFEAMGNNKEADKILETMLNLLSPIKITAIQKANTLFKLINTEPFGLGKTASQYGHDILKRLS